MQLPAYYHRLCIWGSSLLVAGIAFVSLMALLHLSSAMQAQARSLHTVSGPFRNAQTSLPFTTTDSVGVIRNASSEALSDATITLLVAIPTSSTDSNGDGTTGTIFIPWSGNEDGSINPQTTGSDGTYSFAVPVGTYRLRVERAGYQTYVSNDIDHNAGNLIATDLILTPVIEANANAVVAIGENGFSPITLTVAPESVIEFINIDLGEHASCSAIWDSGILESGASYKVQLTLATTYQYTDTINPSATARIIVDDRLPTSLEQLFLPLVNR